MTSMNSWSRGLRDHPSGLGVHTSGLGRSDRSSPRKGDSSPGSSAYTRLLGIAKDHESVCNHLMASTRQFEEQLQNLRVEHEALRCESQAMRCCLDRAGVLPASDVEKEIQQNPPRATPASSSSLGTCNGQAASTSASSWPPLSMDSTNDQSPIEALSSPGLSNARSAAQDYSPPSHGYFATASKDEASLATQDLYELAQPMLDRENQPSSHEQQHSLRLISQLLKNSPEQVHTWNGPGTPLSAAVRSSRVDLARVLLRARASPNEKDPKGVSALHLATFDGCAELCRALLVARADVDCCDRHGQTSLFFAPTREVCKLLVEKKADISVLNRKGQSALHLAGRAGLQEVLAWLSSRVTRPLLELKDVHGATARNYAMQTGLPAVSKDVSRTGDGYDAAGPLPSVSEIVEDEISMAGSSRDGESKAAVSGYPVKNWGSAYAQNKASVPAASRRVPATAPPKTVVPASRASPARQVPPSRAAATASPTRRPPSSTGPVSPQPKSATAAPSSAGGAKPRSDPGGKPTSASGSQDSGSARAATPAVTTAAAAVGSGAAAFGVATTLPPLASEEVQRFDMMSHSDSDLTEDDLNATKRGSLEAMYEEGFAGKAASVKSRKSLESTEPKKTPVSDLEAMGIMEDDSPPAEASAQDLEELGVLDGLADDGIFEDLGPLPEDAAPAELDDLAAAGVLDDLEDYDCDFPEDSIVEPAKPPAAQASANSSAADLAAAGIIDDDEVDLAELGILDEEELGALGEDIGELGELPSDNILEDLRDSGVMDLEDDGIFDDDAAALAEAGVLDTDADDLKALADAGVFDGDEDALAEAGVFNESLKHGHLPSVTEEEDYDAEDDYDAEEGGAEEGEEEEDAYGDEIEEAW